MEGCPNLFEVIGGPCSSCGLERRLHCRFEVVLVLEKTGSYRFIGCVIACVNLQLVIYSERVDSIDF